MMYLLIIGAVIFMLAAFVMTSYNGLVHSNSLVQEAWSGIDVQLKRRYDLIPNFVNMVKAQSIREKSIIHYRVNAPAVSTGAVTVNQKEKARVALNPSL